MTIKQTPKKLLEGILYAKEDKHNIENVGKSKSH
jgi:hypothetical protein